LPSVLLATLSILLTYWIARQLWGRMGAWVGAGAALLHAFNPLMIRLVSGTIPTDHVDAITVFFAQLALLFCVRGGLRGGRALAILAGIAMGAAYLCKSVAVFVLLPAALFLLSGERSRVPSRVSRCLYAGVAFVVTALPWQLYSHLRWPREYAWESTYSVRHLVESLEGHHHGPTWYLELLPIHLGGVPWVVYLLALGAIAGFVIIALGIQIVTLTDERWGPTTARLPGTCSMRPPSSARRCARSEARRSPR